MSSYTSPLFRRKGIGLKLAVETIKKVDPENKMTLFAWPYSSEGEIFTKKLEESIGRPIKLRTVK